MKKEFDCLKMKEEVQSKVYKKIKDMTFPELRAYLDKSLANDVFWQKLLNRTDTQVSTKWATKYNTCP